MLYSGLQLTVTSYIQKFPIACQLHTTAHPSFHVDIQAHLHSNNMGFLADRKLKMENLAASF